MSNDDRMKSRRKVVGNIEIHLTYTLNHHLYSIYIYHIYIYITYWGGAFGVRE